MLGAPAEVVKYRAMEAFKSADVAFDKGATVFVVGVPDASGMVQVSKQLSLLATMAQFVWSVCTGCCRWQGGQGRIQQVEENHARVVGRYAI